jgi:ATP-binding protein involved in chromosome partitioning
MRKVLRIATVSGKGGTGKSTVTVSMAYAFKEMGKVVGILDCDLTGPNINIAMGIDEDKETVGIDAKRVKYIPIEKDSIKVLSMASILPKESALMIKGSDSNEQAYTKSSIMKEFIYNVDWGPLDILLVDLPPGTGDEAQNIIQHMKPDGVIVVTTPHSYAYADYLRVMNMLELYEIRIFKTIVNMAYLEIECPHPEVCEEQDKIHTYNIFGDGKFEYSNSIELPLLPEVAQTHIIDLHDVAEEIEQKFVVA